MKSQNFHILFNSRQCEFIFFGGKQEGNSCPSDTPFFRIGYSDLIGSLNALSINETYKHYQFQNDYFKEAIKSSKHWQLKQNTKLPIPNSRLMKGNDLVESTNGTSAIFSDSDPSSNGSLKNDPKFTLETKVPKDHNQALKTPSKSIIKLVKKAILDYNMIQSGDRVLLGLSGGKDSLTLLHTLAYLRDQKGILGFTFELGACTVDPQTKEYQPEKLKIYLKQLNIPYFFESQSIIERAKECSPDSICAWCSRHKRGILCTAARREQYNVLALGQHLDDSAETFLMSAFHNGILKSMKACFTTPQGDIRIIRPFTFLRERALRDFALEKKLP